MNFIKKLFSNKKKEKDENTLDISQITGQQIKEVINEDYFNKRYRTLSEKDMILLDGSIKMVDSFFLETTFVQPVENEINHPENLDFAATHGYLDFCKKYGFGNGIAASQLAFAFSKYMIDKHNMIFYFDSEPENQNRVFTIKKDINRITMSLYPLEYCLQVIANQKTFTDIVKKIIEKENNPPEIPDILKKYMS